MINNAKQNTDYESLELLKKIESIIGTTINGYIQDQTTIVGGLTYIDKVTNKLFTPGLLDGSTKTGTWATADSDFLPYNMTLIDGDVGKVEIIPYTGILPPRTIKGNGAAISRVTYAKLFAKYGTTFGAGDGVNTFNLPDFRGYFPRFWDDGRGVDSGRVLGSNQTQDLQPHKHLENSLHFSGNVGKTYSNINGSEQRGADVDVRIRNSDGGYYGFSPYTQNSTGIETRPRNVAFMAVIKY